MESFAQSGGLVAVVVVLSMTIVELFKFMLSKMGNKKNGSLSVVEHEALFRIDKLLSKTDGDGVPMCFVPRGWLAVQKDILEINQDILDINKEIKSNQDTMIRLLEK